jgi:hypothetical protein
MAAAVLERLSKAKFPLTLRRMSVRRAACRVTATLQYCQGLPEGEIG